MNIHEYVGHAQ